MKIAQSVGPTSRATCGTCHFYGGGGDHVKHGDLDTSMANPTPEVDIHMGGEKKMNCQDCHQAKDHFLKGEAASVTLTTPFPPMSNASTATRGACTRTPW